MSQPDDDRLNLRMDYEEADALLRLLKGWPSEHLDDDLLDGLARSLVHRMKLYRKRVRKTN